MPVDILWNPHWPYIWSLVGIWVLHGSIWACWQGCCKRIMLLYLPVLKAVSEIFVEIFTESYIENICFRQPETGFSKLLSKAVQIKIIYSIFFISVLNRSKVIWRKPLDLKLSNL